MTFVDAFIGTPQTKYAAIVILIAVSVVSVSVLFTKEKIPIGQKVGIALLIFLVSIPSILYMLFQMTCIVTGSGGEGGETWWCGAFAWILLGFIVVYAIVIVALTIMSLVAERNMKAFEEFYSNKDMYDSFASEMISDVDAIDQVNADANPMMQESTYLDNTEYFKAELTEDEKAYGRNEKRERFVDGAGMISDVANMVSSIMPKNGGLISMPQSIAPSMEAFTASASLISPSPAPGFM
jgi:ABC-type multidrug transport system fused ATPase/permease subunit